MNVTESFLPNIDTSAPEPEPSFVDSQYKVYVGNLAKTVTTEVLKNFFSEKGEVLSATVSRIPGTPKSKGYGFVTFSSEEEVDAAVSTFNNTVSFFCTKMPPASVQLFPHHITLVSKLDTWQLVKIIIIFETQSGPILHVQMN